MAFTGQPAREIYKLYARKVRKKPRHEEDALHVACIEAFALRHPSLVWHLHHSPNGGRRSEREAARFKKMGVRPGVLDLQLFMARGGYIGFWCELKRPDGTWSPAQKAMAELFRAEGYYVCEARTVDTFLAEISKYLALPKGRWVAETKE